MEHLLWETSLILGPLALLLLALWLYLFWRRQGTFIFLRKEWLALTRSLPSLSAPSRSGVRSSATSSAVRPATETAETVVERRHDRQRCPYYREPGLCVAAEPELVAMEIAVRATINHTDKEEKARAAFVLAQSHELGFAHLAGDDWPAVPDLRGTEVAGT